MQAIIEITWYHWVIFTAVVLVILAIDLGLFHRTARAVRFKEALGWTCLWVALAISFAAVLWKWQNKESALEFFTGYFIELSLSVDNVLVIALIFASFKIPAQFQHRVLFWGILAALILRGAMIWMGMALIVRFDWVLYVFGIFLVLTGIKMLLALGVEERPQDSKITRFVQRIFPLSSELDGQKFVTRIQGRRFFTPLFLALILVETVDLVFAFDSIPAIFGVTHQPFIAFTSNVFAILGLRSLFFVLAGAIEMFRHLKIGLSAVLIFIGVKMVLDPHTGVGYSWQIDIPTGLALGVVVGIIGLSMLTSVIAARRNGKNHSVRP